jgi:rhomboid protease GluP
MVRNFLNHQVNNNALLWSILTLAISLIMSQVYWSYGWGDLLAASPKGVFGEGQYWRLFTSSFIHGDLSHFLSNSVMLSIMGYFVTYHYGVWIYPVISFLFGILINLIVIWNYPPEASLVGASGIVYYLWGFWLVNFILIQRQITLNRRLMKATAVGIFILVPTTFKPQVSYYAHGVGLFLGIVSGLFYYFINFKKIRSYEVWEEVIEEEVEEDEEDEEVKYLH